MKIETGLGRSGRGILGEEAIAGETILGKIGGILHQDALI